MFETRRGSLKSQDFQQYLRRITDHIVSSQIRKAVIIIDNAPAHSKAESQLQEILSRDHRESDFDEIRLLRLAPYSNALNPIENFWSVFKSKVKEEMCRRRAELINDAIRLNDESLSNKRMRILEETAQNAAQEYSSFNMNIFFTHLFRHLPRAIQQEDMLVGE